MPRRRSLQFAVVHADESCLRNGQEGPNPGGAGALIEVRLPTGIARRDVYISSPDTTNQRMAISGAIATFALVSQKGNRFHLVYVSDSQYLVKGMSEWVPGWQARGWRRRGGPVENLELWQKLVQVTEGHRPVWRWVRGHAGHVKNEYANFLAQWAAQNQVQSPGAVDSRFDEWLAERRALGRFLEYHPDRDFARHEAKLSEP